MRITYNCFQSNELTWLSPAFLYLDMNLGAHINCEQKLTQTTINTIRTMASNEGNLSSKELLEAQSHVWHDMFGFMRSFSIKCAIELGIPDVVHRYGKPIALTDLAAALSIPPCRIPHFRRLMGLLVHNGYFKQTDEDIYSLTPNSRVLVRDKGASITPFIELTLYQPMLDPWQSLPTWFKSEQPATAFAMCHGLPVWEATATMPGLINS